MIYRFILIFLMLPSLVYAYTIVRKDGKEYSGDLISETKEEFVLKEHDGMILKFKTDQIDRQKTIEKNRQSEDAQKPVLNETKAISNTRWTGEKISVDFKDIDIRDFLLFIADFAGMNIIIDPAVKGSITLKMNDVPWDQVLDLVCKTYGLGYEVNGTNVNIKRY